jgi:N-carbamoylputrescine amidase
MTKDSYTIGLVQYAMAEDANANLETAARLVRRASEAGASVVCLPELCATPYFCKTHDESSFGLAEGLDGPGLGRMAKAAREAGVTLVVPFFERRAPGLYHNSAVVLSPDGGLLGHYRKLHIPEDPGFHEKYYFTPGDLGVLAVDTPAGRIGVLICWDQWFPEAARLTALAGAEVIFYPTAIGRLESESPQQAAEMRAAWQVVQRGHAVANGLYVAAVNRTGFEPSLGGGEGVDFWGGSFVADPMGVLVAEATADDETVLLATVDRARIESVRRTWPFLRDRRVEAYGGLLARFGS